MPVSIVHQNIVRLSCDAVVNPTDGMFSGSGGADESIHLAAGAQLAEACKALPPLEPGAVAVTPGFDLCPYVIHTRGPKWQGGGANEQILLRSCYLNALLAARKLELNSVAFPLIASGLFGFPKDQVLRIALDAMGDFLSQSDRDMDITLCIYDPHSYTFSSQSELARFLEQSAPPPMPMMCSAMPMEAPKRRSSPRRAKLAEVAEDVREMASSMDLSAWIKKQDDTFAVTLLKLIDQKGMTEVQCYKKANVSKKTFWKINNDPKYRPSKATVLAFAIALELDLPQTEQLLKTVGFSLSHSSTFDMIIEFYITRGIYDIFEINSALYQYDQICLGC